MKQFNCLQSYSVLGMNLGMAATDCLMRHHVLNIGWDDDRSIVKRNTRQLNSHFAVSFTATSNENPSRSLYAVLPAPSSSILVDLCVHENDSLQRFCRPLAVDTEACRKHTMQPVIRSDNSFILTKKAGSNKKMPTHEKSNTNMMQRVSLHT